MLPRRRPGVALRAVERLVGRAFAGPAGQRVGEPLRPDWARAYRLFDRELGLRLGADPARTVTTVGCAQADRELN